MKNRDLKCQESIMLALTTGLHNDLGALHEVPPRETERDVNYVRNRTKRENVSFLTKTLPNLGKALDSALLSGTFQCPSAFKRHKSTNLPCYMQWFFRRIFCEDGTLLENPDIQVIKDVRQVAYLFYKYQLPYPDHLVTTSIQEFIDDDNNIKALNSDVETQSTLYYAQEVINEILKDFQIATERPKNGPGSVANALKPWQRYKPSRYYKSLDALIPYDRFYFVSDRHLFDCWSLWWELEHGFEGRAKLIAVPKDSRGPRLISSEQSEYMAYQQCLRRELVPHIENHRLSGGRVCFADQTVNGQLALRASKTGDYATLDLSKASDLLSLDLVDALYEETAIHQYLMNSRSSSTKTPLGNQILRKFAPMGSALCFPIQALTYYALVVGRLVANGARLGDAAHMVYVYGDDIIVPTKYVHEAISVLESVGLKINVAKSCFTGKFRESCGVDAYNGVDITPIKIKKLWNTKPDVQTIVSWVAIANSLFENGFWRTSDIIRRKVEGTWGKLPLSTGDSPILGWTAYSREHAAKANLPKLRWNHDLQTFTLRARCVHTRSKERLFHGWQRLLRYGWEASSFDEDPLAYLNSEPFATGTFTDRNAVTIKHCVVTEASF